MSAKAKKELARFNDLSKRIKKSSSAPLHESSAEQEARIQRLLSDHTAFCRYYFGTFMDTDFAWFHKKAHKNLMATDNYYGVWRWPRGHAKSVFTDVMEPMFLQAKNQLSGLLLGSANNDKALGLLHDIQAQLESNERFIADFGEQKVYGDWGSDHFVTKEGIGFWAFGAGQSPRGAREAEKRPNVGIIDDIDTKDLCKNETRVDETVNWVNEDFVGALDLKGKRFILIGNRIAKYSVNSLIAGDVEEGQAVRKGVDLIEVFALENPKTHKEDQSEKGVPAWDRYTRQELETRFAEIGYRSAQREYFHKHITEGKVFRHEWFQYVELPKLNVIPYHVTYNDPSFKDTKRNDYKAIVWVAKYQSKYYIVDCWVRQASQDAMVKAHFNMAKARNPNHELNVRHYYEANFIQDMHQKAYDEERKGQNYELFIRKDERSKPNKVERITQVALLFEQGAVLVNKELKNNSDWLTLLDQFTAFPSGHDDGPDAFEGGVQMLNLMARTEVKPVLALTRRTASNRL